MCFPNSSRLALSIAVLLLAAAPAAGSTDPVVPTLDPPSAEPVDLRYGEPTSASELYRALGKAFGVHVILDPRLEDSKLALELDGVTAEQAFDTLTRAAGHFATVVDSTTLVIADDTPANRRQYEAQVLRAFQLENIELVDAMTLVRSLLGVKHATAHEQLRTLVVRDTAAKIEVVAELLRLLDRPQGEVTVNVELLYLGASELERLGAALGGTLPERLTAEQLARVREAAQPLTSQDLSILDDAKGSLKLRDQIAVAAGETISYLDVGLELAVDPRVHPASDEVTLEVAVELVDAADDERSFGPVASTRSLESGIRLANGETFLITALDRQAGGEARDSWLASRFDLPGEPGEIVLALTPRIVRGPGFTDSDLTALCVGTESLIELCGLSRPRLSRPRLSRPQRLAASED